MNDSRTASRQRLNPFAFPSDTGLRFALLIIALLGTTLFAYEALYLGLFPAASTTLRSNRAYTECVESAFATRSADPFSSAAAEAAGKCRELSFTTDRKEAVWMLAGVMLLLAVAGTIYSTAPVRRIRQDHLLPLREEDAPGLLLYLAGLCQEVGLSPAPTFLWNPLRLERSATAFGGSRRAYVALSGGLVAQLYADRPAFRAVLLHELAHLVNRDVAKTHLTLAVWQAFVVVAVLPLALLVLLLLGRSPGFALNLALRVLALVLLVYLTRNGILRAREVYADVRASVWDGPGGALRRLLENLAGQASEGWKAVFRVHPGARHRRIVADVTDSLFQMSFWDALGTGVATTVAVSSIGSFLFYLGLPTMSPALIVGLLAGAIVGLGAWRAAFRSLVRADASVATGAMGLGLGLGCIGGQVLSSEGYVEQSAFGSLAAVGLELILSALLVVGVFFLVKWIGAAAAVWLEAALPWRSPKPAYLIGLTIAGGLLAFWLGQLFRLRIVGVGISGAQGFLAAMREVGTEFFVRAPVDQPSVVLALVCLWAFPFASQLWTEQASSSTSRWAFLDASRHQESLPPRAPLSLRPALRAGAAVGLFSWLLLFAYWVGWKFLVSESTRHTGQLRFIALQIGSAALLQALLASVVARRATRLREIQGLFAAFVAGCAAVAGIVALAWAFSRRMNLAFLWNTFSMTVNAGALIALLVLAAERLVARAHS